MTKRVLLNHLIFIKTRHDRIVALRGDLPSGQVGLAIAVCLKTWYAFIREHSGDHFHIEVAA